MSEKKRRPGAGDNIIFVDFAQGRRQTSYEQVEEARIRARLSTLEATEPVADVYTAVEVSRLTGLSLSRLRSLDRAGIVSPSSRSAGRRAYSFRDLIVLRTVQGLLARKVKTKEVALAVRALRSSLPRVKRPLAELRIVSDGRRVVVRSADGSFEPLTGQMLLDFDVRQLRDDVVRVLRPRNEQDRLRVAFELYERASRLDEDPATFDEAASLYRRALELDPSMAIAYTNLGNIQFRRGKEDEAIELYHRALDIDPAQAEAQYNLGYLLLDRGHAAAALPFFEGAVQSNSLFADAHFYLAMAYESVGDRERARPSWLRYLQLEPTGTWADIARRHLLWPRALRSSQACSRRRLLWPRALRSSQAWVRRHGLRRAFLQLDSRTGLACAQGSGPERRVARPALLALRARGLNDGGRADSSEARKLSPSLTRRRRRRGRGMRTSSPTWLALGARGLNGRRRRPGRRGQEQPSAGAQALMRRGKGYVSSTMRWSRRPIASRCTTR